MEKIRIILYGVGAVGSRIAKFLLQKEGVKIVGAIDIAKEKVAKDLGEVLALGRQLGVAVSNDLDAVLSKVKADVVVHATTSFLKQAYPQITKAIEQGANVVSTCEELSYPYLSEPELAKKLDELAKKHRVTVLGTGINPGFIMDTLIIALTGVCQKVETIKVTRAINAATRRDSFQKKIGVGLTVDEFKQKMEGKVITGHVGLEQSISMIASALGWKLDKIEVETKAIELNPGQVAGIRQLARGIRRGRDAITLDLQAYVGAEEEYDSINIEGVPGIQGKISPCVHGDLATVAIVVNSIPKVINAEPGLVTMKDLPVPSAALEDMRTYVKK
ncbi:Gfo/Idh/MocA family oxidoreductase [Candidatus Bathyarchaeota archaeon]|nr:Gfo/Idh/MocA family oxidoreductase [Candidatus Bathyarchaeota archaeon]